MSQSARSKYLAKVAADKAAANHTAPTVTENIKKENVMTRIKNFIKSSVKAVVSTIKNVVAKVKNIFALPVDVYYIGAIVVLLVAATFVIGFSKGRVSSTLKSTESFRGGHGAGFKAGHRTGINEGWKQASAFILDWHPEMWETIRESLVKADAQVRLAESAA